MWLPRDGDLPTAQLWSNENVGLLGLLLALIIHRVRRSASAFAAVIFTCAVDLRMDW
jgi:hypothetical protein